MKSKTPKILPVIFVILLALASVQGSRIDDIKASEAFYRWTLSVASLTRLGDTLEPDASSDLAEAMDDEVFAQLNEIAEKLLPDYPVDEDLDIDSDGAIQSRLLRAVRQSQDKDVWKLITTSDLKEVKKRFRTFLSNGQIQSSGMQFDATALYGDAANVDGVGLTSMFFGMRSLAANFLWMQVESYWHDGQLHRMVPLMRTCVSFDPNFIDAYLLGAWHLAYNIPAKIEATPEPLKVYNEKYNKRIGLQEEWFYLSVEFLKDGIRKNPRDYRLYFDLGYAVYEQKLHDHKNAILYLDEARRHKHDKWVPRMLFRSLTLNEQFEDAIEGWEEYLEDFPGHEVGTRLLEINRGYLAEAIADDAHDCKSAAERARENFQTLLETAQANNNQIEIDKLIQSIQKADQTIESLDVQIEMELAKAMTIWNTLLEDDRDTIAAGRIVRRNAITLRHEGRYLEAIAALQIIRWKDLQFFNKASNLIIDIKTEADFPLTVSEQLEVFRQQDALQYMDEEDRPKVIRRVHCDYDLEDTA